jgi:hypothetical protein
MKLFKCDERHECKDTRELMNSKWDELKEITLRNVIIKLWKDRANLW